MTAIAASQALRARGQADRLQSEHLKLSEKCASIAAPEVEWIAGRLPRGRNDVSN